MIHMSPLAIAIYEALKVSGAKPGIPFEISVADLAEQVDIHADDFDVITEALNDLFRAQDTKETSTGSIVHRCIDHIEVMHSGSYLIVTLGT
jgi:hypothetical protein